MFLSLTQLRFSYDFHIRSDGQTKHDTHIEDPSGGAQTNINPPSSSHSCWNTSDSSTVFCLELLACQSQQRKVPERPILRTTITRVLGEFLEHVLTPRPVEGQTQIRQRKTRGRREVTTARVQVLLKVAAIYSVDLQEVASWVTDVQLPPAWTDEAAAGALSLAGVGEAGKDKTHSSAGSDMSFRVTMWRTRKETLSAGKCVYFLYAR
ncbi:hypothetical protein WMY93_030288 [Mugilogobius chulae]|uniref:Uncharacterized protein n=1 Tax=Mugilogobius chulae TaxID=88201 RepID=A0AAW0MVQ4_9GOBI